MSAVLRPVPRAAGAGVARIALLGTGTVGTAVLERLAGWSGTPLAERLALERVANSRAVARPPQPGAGIEAFRADAWPQAAVTDAGGALEDVVDALGPTGTRIVVDATASDAVAARHAEWLARGVHVVTACKLGQGTALAR